MRYPRILARFSISRRLLLIVWPFLAIVVLLVVMLLRRDTEEAL